ncbi:hypothetical protein MSPP1_004021 [Malassezia sp. CBS 17886]|nr:hypothetical protein MSPP1_004021 [Malassezia sp. CBS 17886]
MDATASGRVHAGDDTVTGDVFSSVAESPVQFFFSRYTALLLAMVVVVNRIQHVCTPHGRPARVSATQRALMRLPAVVFLARALWGLIQAMCADTHTASAEPWLRILRRAVPPSTAPVDVPVLFWHTFLAGCVAQCVGTTVRSLELIGAQDDPSTFNLVSFAFTLHIHATSREFQPNAHVFLIVIFKVVELLGMNVILSVKPPMLSRLTFTSVLGVLSTLHYLSTIAMSSEYPVLHSASRLTEILVIAVIVLTVGLHALTMYLVDGSVDRSRLLFSRSNLPRWTDDFSLAVLKIGSACLYATHHTGLACEVKALEMPRSTYVELLPNGDTVVENSMDDYEEMDAFGVNGLGKEVRDVRVVLEKHGIELGGVVRGADKLRERWNFVWELADLAQELLARATSGLADYLPTLPAVLQGLPRTVRLFWHGTNGERERSEGLQQASQRRAEAEAFLQRLQLFQRRQACRREGVHQTQRAPPAWALRGADDLDPVELLALAQVPLAVEQSDTAPAGDLFLKHLMRPDHTPPLTRSAYRQIAELRDRCAAPAPAPPAWQPATTLSSLLPNPFAQVGQTDSDAHTQRALLKLLQERRRVVGHAMPPPEALARLCVVCCAEERTVVCWPCRCLALCDDCRGTLASHQHSVLTVSAPGVRPTQLCPTCRTPVMAFSRLYIP